MAVPAPHAPLTVEYVVDGPRSAAAVARGQSRLLGAVLCDAGRAAFVAGGEAQEALRRCGDRPRVYHDAVYGKCVERRYALPQAAVFDDVRLMLRLLNEHCDTDAELGIDTAGPGPANPWPDLAAAERDRTVGAAVTRAAMIAPLAMHLSARLAAEQLGQLYEHVELPATAATAEMVATGIGVDFERLDGLLARYQGQTDLARGRLQQIAGRPVNPDSYPEMCAYLFGELDLPVEQWTEHGNPAVGDAVLHRFESAHPAVPLLRDYWTARPILIALQAIDRFASRATGRIHPDLDQLGAVTGRYSCREPNLQALPPAVLPVLQASEGCVLMEADLSQTELRVLAQVTQDPGLVEAFRGGVDVHRRTAARVLGIAEAAVTAEQRQRIGKPVNFGILYGQTEHSLANELGSSPVEARRFIDAYIGAYPLVQTWIEHTHQQLAAYGYISTMYGRRRRFPQFARLSGSEQRRTERQAVNAVIQGTAADLLKLALARLHQVLPAECRLLLTAHDSVMLEAPAANAPRIAELVRQELERPPPHFGIPLIAGIKMRQQGGDGWESMLLAGP